MKAIILAVLFGLAISPMGLRADDDREIRNIIKSFGEAITDKDKGRFLSLFTEEGVSWVGVFSEVEFGKFRDVEGTPGKIMFSNPGDFMDWVENLDGVAVEEFNDISINTDGEIASVYFDYKFFVDKKLYNWGSEGWLLAKTEEGWRIHAVNFSYTSDN